MRGLLWWLSLPYHCILGVYWAVWAVTSIILFLIVHGYPRTTSGPDGVGRHLPDTLTFEITALTGWDFGVSPLGRGGYALWVGERVEWIIGDLKTRLQQIDR